MIKKEIYSNYTEWTVETKDDDPSARCSECIQADELGVDIMADFEPNRGCLLWEPEGRLIARGQHDGK